MSDKPEVKLEPCYVTFGLTDIDRYLSKIQQAQLNQMDLQIAIGRADEGKAPFDSLIIEKDWPEFAPAWDAIKTRMEAEHEVSRITPIPDEECENKRLIAENIKLKALYEQNHKELLQIHSIACHGWANVLEQPITPEDPITVRGVKQMAMELLEMTK